MRKLIAAAAVFLASIAAAHADVVTPEQKGAVGDCVANDTAALQAAINEAQATNGVVDLGTRCYLFTPPLQILQANGGPIKMQGKGQFLTQLKAVAGSADNLINIGQSAPLGSQLQGVEVSGLTLTGNGQTAGYAISARHVANTVMREIFLDSTWGGIEDEQSNNDLIEHVWGYTTGTNSQALLWWADAAALAVGGRSDQLTVSDFHVNTQYLGNDGVVLKGMAQTLNGYNITVLAANNGFYVDNSLNTVSVFPAFVFVHNLQIEGGKTSACRIAGGRYMTFTDAYCYDMYGATGQGNNDTAALWITPDATASNTSSISFIGGSIGISRTQAAILQGQGIYFTGTLWRGAGLSAANTYPSVELVNPAVGGSADYIFTGNKFCGTFGDTVQNSYGIVRQANVGQTVVQGSDFNYCQTGEIQDNAADRMIVTGGIDRNLKPLPESTHVFISNAVPTLGADCGAGATISASSNNTIGEVHIGGAGAVAACTINFTNSNAAANNGNGATGPVIFQSTTGNQTYLPTVGITANAVTFGRSDGTNMGFGEVIYYRAFPFYK